jgi:Uma2 family endonuclease
MSELISPLPDLYEVIDGEIVECPPMSVEAIACANDLSFALSSHGLAKNLGKAYTEMLIQMPEPMNRDRRPDAIFVSFEKWPKGKRHPSDRSWDIVPDLCVEVVSPSDEAGDLREKVIEYFEAGVPLVWVVYPQQEVVDVYDSPESTRTIHRKGTLTGGTIIPGFSLPLEQLFPRPTP